MERKEQEELEIDVRDLFQMLKKRITLIISITLVVTLLSGLISYFVLTPMYESSTELLVNKSETDMNPLYSYNDIQTNLKLIETYSVIIKSPRIIDLVISNDELDLTSEQLIAKIKVNAVKNSQVISITVTDTNPEKVVMLVNAIASTFKTEIKKIMKVDNVQILTEAKIKENPKPIKPKPVLNILIAFMLGLIFSVGLVFLLEYMDTTIKTEQEVEKLLGYPVLGSIATIGVEIGQKNKRKRKKAQATMVGVESFEA